MLIELLTERYPGMRAWLTQRLTGLVMAIYSIVALLRFFIIQPENYEAWVSFFQPIWWRIASLIFWLALSMHAWLGIRDVFKDYVPNYVVQRVLQNILVVLLWIYLAWVLWLLLV
ncbi:succinate dehydrogenase, hydrophobic membrane anchor protein [Methylotenera sp.]|uniref:succinate dehydrogenase, hydrophobic membrane anchor protein n=1 Tax=Methylotenera sp. TaxID=2051956 RepID=UPI002730ED66|nr:succinate dehydrogenase, hydrophobic membrane anchor protein [Methylotenera sp.]MDP2070425.1 succinate dehydrogenase, hydrophobic membrane anchor protein [Methylotenera sp.]MDP3006597.1 succinate dehydrogenase, hydrophobic membrane anchor protein [Methylotenera sp.]